MAEFTIDPVRLATAYRNLVLAFGGQLVLSIVVQALDLRRSIVVALLIVVLAIASLSVLAVYSYQTAQALGLRGAPAWAVAMAIPCVNVIALLALSAKAQAACRAANIPVGFLGPKLPPPGQGPLS